MDTINIRFDEKKGFIETKINNSFTFCIYDDLNKNFYEMLNYLKTESKDKYWALGGNNSSWGMMLKGNNFLIEYNISGSGGYSYSTYTISKQTAVEMINKIIPLLDKLKAFLDEEDNKFINKNHI